jgi:hypothetical protein
VADVAVTVEALKGVAAVQARLPVAAADDDDDDTRGRVFLPQWLTVGASTRPLLSSS